MPYIFSFPCENEKISWLTFSAWIMLNRHPTSDITQQKTSAE